MNFFFQIEFSYLSQQVAPLKIKSPQRDKKKISVKSVVMYAIAPVTYHVTFILYILC